MTKRISIIFFLILLCGCAKHTEIEETAIVVGAAIDIKDEQIQLTVETVNTVDAKEGSAKGGVFTCEADSVSEASSKMATAAGKPLYWDHLKLIVISEEALEQRLDELLEWLLRSAHSRIDTPLAVSEQNAKDVLSLKSEGNNFISDALIDLINAAFKNGYTVNKPAYLLYDDLAGESKASLLPYIKVKEEKPVIDGCVAISENKIKTHLNDKQTQTALLLKGRLKSGEIVLKEASFNITDASAKNNIEITNKKAVFSHTVTVTLSLEEIADTNNSKDKLVKEVQRYIEENAKELMRLSKTTDCDFLMLRDELKAKESDVYDYIEDYGTELILRVSVKSHGQSKYEGGNNE